jgi:DNA-binding SARP family transcriptional activator
VSAVRVSLFGKFDVEYGGQSVAGMEARKVQELFSHLLLYRDRPHPRETLAGLLWGDATTSRSRKYLRQALWQLQAAFEPRPGKGSPQVLLLDPEWVQINPAAALWLDVAVFEQASAQVQGIAGHALGAQHAGVLRDAVELYRGDLLEGWYQDWCVYERERLQTMFLAMLDKLVGYSEAHHEYEAGLSYGTRVLCYDGAHERTHRRLMRLHYLAGNRSAALRQYETCVAALDQELGVKPARRTVALYEQIRADRVTSSEPGAPAREEPTTLPQVLNRLRQFQTVLAELQLQVQQEIQAVELTLKRQQ